MSSLAGYKETRRVNLIWACRDASLLEFYLDKCDYGKLGWTLIYYTGKRKLQLLLFAPRAEFRVRISAFGSITSNSRSNFPFRCFSVFGMQELIAQSFPDRCLDSIPQTVQLHDVKRGVKSTGQ